MMTVNGSEVFCGGDDENVLELDSNRKCMTL